MYEDDTKLKIVRMLEPNMCYSCNFGKMAQVEMADGSTRRMLHCKRLDCDNWQTEEVGETPRALSDE